MFLTTFVYFEIETNWLGNLNISWLHHRGMLMKFLEIWHRLSYEAKKGSSVTSNTFVKDWRWMRHYRQRKSFSLSFFCVQIKFMKLSISARAYWFSWGRRGIREIRHLSCLENILFLLWIFTFSLLTLYSTLIAFEVESAWNSWRSTLSFRNYHLLIQYLLI